MPAAARLRLFTGGSLRASVLGGLLADSLHGAEPSQVQGLLGTPFSLRFGCMLRVAWVLPTRHGSIHR